MSCDVVTGISYDTNKKKWLMVVSLSGLLTLYWQFVLNVT